MNNKLYKVVTVAVMLVLMLTLVGCGQTGSTTTEGKYGGYSSTLYKVLATKEVTIAVVSGFVPVSYKDESGTYVGYDVDVAQAIADSLGAKLNLLEVTSDTRIPSIETGKADIVLGNSTPTMARAQKVGFSNTYLISSEQLLVKEDSAITGADSLPATAKVGVVKGATLDTIFQRKWPEVELVYFELPTDGILAVKNGQVDAFAEDANFLLYQAKLNGGLKVVGGPLDVVSYNAIMLPIEDQVWINYVNRWVFNWVSAGEQALVFEKWFGGPPSIPIVP